MPSFGLLFFIFVVFFVLNLTIKLLSRKVQRKRWIEEVRGPLIEDPEALLRAEAEVNAASMDEFVHIITLESAQGYSEPYARKLVEELWNEEIQATYDLSPSYGGNMMSFVIKAKGPGIERAREFVRKRIRENA